MKSLADRQLEILCAAVKANLEQKGIRFRGEEPYDPAISCLKCGSITRHSFRYNKPAQQMDSNGKKISFHRLIYTCSICGEERTWGSF